MNQEGWEGYLEAVKRVPWRYKVTRPIHEGAHAVAAYLLGLEFTEIHHDRTFIAPLY